MEEQIRHILKALGEDPDREGLIKTPHRVAQALAFLTQGYQQDPAKVINDALFTEDYEEMIVQRDIDFYSFANITCCPSSVKPTSPIYRTTRLLVFPNSPVW